MRRDFVWTVLLVATLTLAGCGDKKHAVTAEPRKPDAPASTASHPEALPPGSLDRSDLARALAVERRRTKEIRDELQKSEAARASLEERFKALEIELAQTLEEVLRSKANLRSMQSRALATSLIAEVRVSSQAVQKKDDFEVQDRLQRANHFLVRADQALEEGNFGGAAYLAERASELVRQANSVSQFRIAAPNQPPDVIPIVPPRSLEAVVKANLREEPGTTAGRVGTLEKGQRVLALARLGTWFQIETEAGVKAWVHQSVVR